jgi:HK97 family phage portal protein
LRLATQFRSFLSNASFRADSGLGIIGSPSPDSDYWYHGLGHRSAAGPNVSPGTATRLAAVYACTRVCAETQSSLPPGIYRERKSGGRDLAKDHPAQELFLEPNPWQTGMEFFEMMQGHLELRGNAYAHKVPGNGRAIDQLIPLHPDRVRVYLLPNNRLRYEVTSYATGHIDRFTQDEILHLRAWSFDGIMGVSTVSAMAEVIGVGLAQQEHRARYFRNHAIPGMSIETLKMTPEAEATLRESLSEGFSGENAFKAMILPPGMKAQPLGLTSKDSQLIEASNATRIEICGAWRVPPHKIGDLSRGTFSNIEQQNIEFATDCMRPRVVRFERRLDRDIVNALRAYESSPGDYFVTFNMDALYRGDMKSRYEAYAAAMPWMLRNEMRAAEGKNPIDGLDEPLVAVNMETVSQAQARNDANNEGARGKATSDEKDEEETANGPGSGGAEVPEDDNPDDEKQQARAREKLATARLRAIAINSADRIVRREVTNLRKMAAKSPADPERFKADVSDFYRDLEPVVAEALAIHPDVATAYCERHVDLITCTSCTDAALLDMAIDQVELESSVHLADLAMEARFVTA